LTGRRKVQLDIIVEQLYLEYHNPLALVSVRRKPRLPDSSKGWVPISHGDRDLTWRCLADMFERDRHRGLINKEKVPW